MFRFMVHRSSSFFGLLSFPPYSTDGNKPQRNYNVYIWWLGTPQKKFSVLYFRQKKRTELNITLYISYVYAYA